MSQRGGRPIDFQAWAQNQIVKRAVAALEARDEAFAERNADTPLPQLARYLSRCAISLGHSPSPSEVDGGTFIEQRFGSWAAAMAAARLPQPRSMRKLRDTARYKAEKVKQEPLFREERRQKRQRKLEQSEQRKKEQAMVPITLRLLLRIALQLRQPSLCRQPIVSPSRWLLPLRKIPTI